MSRRAVTETFEQRVNREALESHRADLRQRAATLRRAAQRVLQPPAGFNGDQDQGINSRHYQGAELRPFAGRPGAMNAYAPPSRTGNRLHHPDGRVTGLQGEPLEA